MAPVPELPVIDPSHPATQDDTHKIHADPRPITQSGSASSPKGAARAAIAPAGMTTAPITGTVSRLAISPKSAMRLKCAAPYGAVANPATSDDITTVKAGLPQRGTRGARKLRHGVKPCDQAPPSPQKTSGNPAPTGFRASQAAGSWPRSRQIAATAPAGPTAPRPA